VASSSLTVAPASATGLTVESAADGSGAAVGTQNITAGNLLAAYAISRDAYGNVGNPSVTWSLTSKTGGVADSDLAATSGASTTFNGHLTGAATLHAVLTSPALSANSGTLTVVAAAASKLAFTTTTQTLTAGVISGTMTLQMQDASGNPIYQTGSDRTVTLATSSAGGIFRDTGNAATISSVTLPVGSSSVSFLYKDTLAASATLTAATSLPSPLSSATQAETVNVAAAAQLAFTIQPGGGTGGTAWTSQPAVTLRDAYGNTVTGTAQNVTLAIQNHAGSGSLSGTVTAAVNTSTGVATLSGLSIDKIGSGYTLTATGNTVSTTAGGVVSSPFNITTGTATKLAYTSVPSTGTAATAFSVTLQSQDAGGNPASPTSTTTIALTKATGGGTLSGTLTGSILTSGNSVTISTPVYSKSDTLTLAATATAGMTGLPAVTSDNIVFSAGAADASHSTMSPATASLTANGTSTQVITVQARDTNNNNRTSGGDAVVFPIVGPGSLSSTTDNGNGTYTTTLTSPTTHGVGSITATLGGTAVGTAVAASSSVVTYTLGVTSLATASSTTAGTTLAITVPAGGVPLGNTAIVSFAMDPLSGTVSASDTQGNSYTADVDTMQGSSGSGTGVRTVVLSAHVTKALVSGNTITITHPSVTSRAASAGYISGIVTASRVDQTATGGSTSAASSGNTSSATTLFADEVLIGAVGIENSSTALTVGSGYTALTSAAANTGSTGTSIAILPEYRIVSATGAYSASGSGWASGRWAAAMVSYRAPGIATPTAIATNTSTTSGTIITVAAPAAGVSLRNTVIVAVAMDPSSTSVAVSDARGNTYTSDKDVTNGSVTTGVRTLLFSAPVTTALLSGDLITVTFGSAVVGKAVSAYSVNGLVVASRVDQTASAIGASTAPSSGNTAITSQPDELVMGVIGVEEINGTATALTAGSGFTALTGIGTASSMGIRILPEYQIVTAASAYAGNGTLNQSRAWAAAVVTYKMLGGVEPGESTISPATASLTANGTSTQVITVQACDAYGNAFTVGGEAVTIAVSAGSGSVGATTDNGNGTYTATLTAPTATGSGTLSATINGDAVGAPGSAVVTYTAGAVTAAQSTVAASLSSVTADGATTSTITVTLKDSNSNLVAGKTVTLTKTSGAGSPTIATTQGTSDASGLATFTVKSTTAAADVFTATDTSDSVTLTQTATVTFTAGAVTAAQSTVAASLSSVTADGTTTSTITVTLKDSNSNPVAGKTVTLTKTSGAGSPTIAMTQGTSDASGLATFTVKSTTAAADVFTATDTSDSVTVTQTATVTFAAGAVTAAQSTVAASLSSVTADGTTTSTITVTLKDSNSNPVAGKTVTLTKTTGAGSPTITTTQGTTDASGLASFTVKSTTAAADVFTATDTSDSVTVTQTATVTFAAGALDHFAISSIASPQTAGTAITGLTFTAQDAYNNTVTSFVSSVTYTGTAGISGTSATFTAGQLTGVSVMPVTVGSSLTFTATSSGKTGTTSFNINPGAIASYVVSAAAQQTAGTAFSATVTAKDANNNTVTTDSTTVVTMTGTGSAQFDSNGDSTFGDNTKVLTSGAFTISTKDAVPEAVTLTATSAGGKTGSSSSITILNAFYAAWITANYPSLTGANALPGADPDGDGMSNLIEYAFGLNPTSGAITTIAYTGTVLTSAGPPYAANFAAGTGWDYRAVFCRRVNFLTLGLTYTVQFSADNAVWVDSATTPSVLATDAGNVMQAVCVRYPLFIRPGGVVKKAQFFRLGVSITP